MYKRQQDICEKALVDKLKEINANVGVAVLMEVATGEVKAIVNMMKLYKKRGVYGGSIIQVDKGHDKINFFYIFNSNITKFQKRDLVHPS